MSSHVAVVFSKLDAEQKSDAASIAEQNSELVAYEQIEDEGLQHKSAVVQVKVDCAGSLGIEVEEGPGGRGLAISKIHQVSFYLQLKNCEYHLFRDA